MLAELLVEKKARQLRLLKVGKLTSYTDFLLLVTGTSERHVRALADHLLQSMTERKVKPLGVEGYQAGQWLLVDFGDAIVHIFQEPARDYYDLDGLWSEAQEIPLKVDP